MQLNHYLLHIHFLHNKVPLGSLKCSQNTWINDATFPAPVRKNIKSRLRQFLHYRIVLVYSLLDGYVLVIVSRAGKISTAISLNSNAIIPAFARANVSNMAMMVINALKNLPGTHYLPSPTHFLFQTRSSYASNASYKFLLYVSNMQ